MQLGNGLKMTWSLAVAAIALFAATAGWFSGTLPFKIERFGGHTMTVEPMPGIAFPTGLVPGETIDLKSQDHAMRAAILATANGSHARGVSYTLTVHRPQGDVPIPVTTVAVPMGTTFIVKEAMLALADLLLGTMALLLLWRGEGRASLSLALYCTSYVIADASVAAFQTGVWALALICLSVILYASARAGFYLMVDALVGRRLPSTTRRLAHLGFVLLLVVGLSTRLGAYIHFVLTGSAEFLAPVYSLPFSWIYLVPFAVLIAGYLRVEHKMRLRLRWVLVGAIMLLITVTMNNAFIEPSLFISAIIVGFYVFSIVSMAYALLRYRVVDVSIVIDRALVYGLVTTLVIGVIAAVNSLVLRAALPPKAGLLLQVIVPLALGIVLGRVRTNTDRLVEQVFFRKRYLATKALRSFSRHAGQFENSHNLLAAAVREIRTHVGTPAVAIYSADADGYHCLEQAGETVFPEKLGRDDAALVAVRTDLKAVDLSELASGLGKDGWVFPMRVLGNLRGVIVLANRPGERYSSDERTLLTRVAREVGAAWRVLRARDNEALVQALAKNAVPSLEEACDKARTLTLA